MRGSLGLWACVGVGLLAFSGLHAGLAITLYLLKKVLVDQGVSDSTDV